MVALEWAREPAGFALRLRIEPFRPKPTARQAAGALAFAVVAVVLLALGREPLAFRHVPAYQPASVVPQTDLLRPLRPAVTLEREDPAAIRIVVAAPEDSLFTLADRYGVTPQTIAFNNGMSDSAQLRPGMTLRIPAIDAALYLVGKGDTAASVASRFGAGADEVVTVNRLLYEPENFAPGKTVAVPVPDGRFPGYRLKVTEETRPTPIARTLTRPALIQPVLGILTQRFASYHTGVDLAAPYGTLVVSAAGGTIEAVGFVVTGGLRVCVRHDWGLRTCYYHLATALVSEGQRVALGEGIGRIGLTGVTTGPHVHWEASVSGAFVDPLLYQRGPAADRPATAAAATTTTATTPTTVPTTLANTAPTTSTTTPTITTTTKTLSSAIR